MEKEKTPTYKMVGGDFVKLGLALDEEMDGPHAKELTFERMNEIVDTICMIMGKDSDRSEVVHEMKSGLSALELAAGHSVEVRKQVIDGAQELLIGMFKVAIVIASQRVKSEIAKISPLARKNKDKENIIRRACELAQELWRADEEQKVRISDMADIVYSKLAGEGMSEHLPDTIERVKEWLKPVAPSYARKGGRARKPPVRIG